MPEIHEGVLIQTEDELLPKETIEELSISFLEDSLIDDVVTIKGE